MILQHNLLKFIIEDKKSIPDIKNIKKLYNIIFKLLNVEKNYGIIEEINELDIAITKEIEVDFDKDDIVDILLQHYIEPAIDFMSKKNYDEVIENYLAMYNLLKERYKLYDNDATDMVLIKKEI